MAGFGRHELTGSPRHAMKKKRSELPPEFAPPDVVDPPQLEMPPEPPPDLPPPPDPAAQKPVPPDPFLRQG